MLLLHLSMGFLDCRVTQHESLNASRIEVKCSDKSSSTSSGTPDVFPIQYYSSFEDYWRSFVFDPNWFTTVPIYIHPALKKIIQASVNRVPLKELASSEISCLDKWKTYLYFRIQET